MTHSIYIALVHHPVVNKRGDIVTTSVTNFDLHDLSRNSSTYGVKGCFIVTPSQAQQDMVAYIRNYWREGKGADYNPDRKEAFEALYISGSLEESCLTIKKAHDKAPKLIATSAKSYDKVTLFRELREEISNTEDPYLIVFGTGWGLAETIINSADAVLEPIKGPVAYNHLPVRSAVAIVLDRLLGQ